MTDYVANQSGAFGTATVWTPNGVPGAGDTIETAGFAITGVSGTLGDDVGAAITLSGGSVTLSGNVELRPGSTLAGIAFEGGTFNQGAHTVTVAPTGDDRHLATFTNNAGAATTWTSSAGASCVHSTARGSTRCHGFAKADTTAFALTIDWDSMTFDGFGLGTAYPAFNGHNIKAGDMFRWQGGIFKNNGRVYWANITGDFDVDGLAIGWWAGSDYAEGTNTQTWRWQTASAGTTRNFTNCLWYRDTDTRYTFPVFTGANHAIDFSGCVFVGISVSGVQPHHNMSGTTHIQATGGDYVIGFSTNITAATAESTSDIVVMAQSTINPHVPTTTGVAGSSYTFNGLILDGLGSSGLGEIGDQPICNVPTTVNNLLIVHGAGGPQPSLNPNGQINGNRWTIHQGNGIIMGESASAATQIGTVRNVLLSQPKNQKFIFDAGGTLVEQTSMIVDYVAFDPADMAAANEDHPVLAATEGYVSSVMAPYINGYGANDVVVADPGFVDGSRHGLTWASSLGYAPTLTGLRDAVLAGYGVNSTGASVTVDAAAALSAYRTYMAAGYVPTNEALRAAGFGGVDIGAYNLAAAEEPPVDPAVPGAVYAGGSIGGAVYATYVAPDEAPPATVSITSVGAAGVVTAGATTTLRGQHLDELSYVIASAVGHAAHNQTWALNPQIAQFAASVDSFVPLYPEVSVAQVGGQLQVTLDSAAGGGMPRAYRAFNTVPGVTYTVSADFTADEGTDPLFQLFVGGTAGSGTLVSIIERPGGVKSTTFVAVDSITYVMVGASMFEAGDLFLVDDVSLSSPLARTFTAGPQGSLPMTTSDYPAFTLYGYDANDVMRASIAFELAPAAGLTAYDVSDTPNQTNGESILYTVGTIAAGSQVVLPDNLEGAAVTWEADLTGVTGAVYDIVAPFTGTHAIPDVSFRAGDTGVWDTIPATLLFEQEPTISDITCAHTIEAPSGLSQQQGLVAADMTVTPEVDDLEIAQGSSYALAAAQILIAPSLPTISLTAEIALDTDDLAVTPTINGLAITQVQPMTAAEVVCRPQLTTPIVWLGEVPVLLPSKSTVTYRPFTSSTTSLTQRTV